MRGHGRIRLFTVMQKGNALLGQRRRFHGRIDNQVKVNGHRIELGEIESALNEIPNVKESCVVHYKDMGKEKLAAFVVEDSVKDETFAKVNLPKERVCEETIIKFNRLLECAICESVYKGFCDAVKDDDAYKFEDDIIHADCLYDYMEKYKLRW